MKHYKFEFDRDSIFHVKFTFIFKFLKIKFYFLKHISMYVDIFMC
jgi:hypothetical protein